MQTSASLTAPITFSEPAIGKLRISSIDLLRGTVMIIMALDHVRDYFHADAFQYDPLDLDKTTPLLFFTRWITHFCAPVFVFLAGTSAFLSGQKKTKKELSLFLLTRGIWLIILELTVINFGWLFNWRLPTLPLIVIWALGVSMIALSVFVHLPKRVILGIGILLVAGHNLLDPITVTEPGAMKFLWALLHQPGVHELAGRNIFVGYPILPWIGLMALGYCFGQLYSFQFDALKRKRLLIMMGVGAILLFIILRFTNVYGDPVPWSQQSSSFSTFLSFLRTTKYPPSLLYLLMTIGPALLFLAFSERPIGKVGRVISVFGRVPLFYYILHIYIIHLVAMIAAEIAFTDWSTMIVSFWVNFEPQLQGYGFDLWLTYVIWILLVAGLYPLCKLYDQYKTNHKEKKWLSYL